MNLKKLFTNKGFHVGIEINGNNLRLVLLKRNKQSKLKIINKSQKLAGGTIENGIIVNRDEVLNKLKEIVNYYGVKGCKASTTIVSRLVIVKYLSLPKIKDDELIETMKWEINQNLPYSEQDAVCDWCKLTDLPNNTRVVMAAAPKDITTTYCEIFNEVDLKLQHIDIAPASLKRWLWYLGSKNWPDFNVLSIGIVHVGDEIINLVIIRNGEIEFSRTIVINANGDYLTTLTDELHTTLKYYESNFTNQLARLILTGSLEHIQSLHNSLVKKIEIPVEIGVVATEDENIGPDFAVAAGLALRGIE